MKRLKVNLLLFCVIMLLFGVAPSALGIIVGFNSDIHQDNPTVVANDFHVEGRIESGVVGGNWSSPPTLVSHIDGNFPNFSCTITPDPCDPGQNWYIIKADWSGYNYPFCSILHLGLFFDATCHNVIYDLVGWWTLDGGPIPPVPIPPPVNGGAVPIPGFQVLDQNLPQVITFRNDSQLFGGGGGGGGGAGIETEIVQMELVSLTREELEMHLGPIPQAFEELRVDGNQMSLPWTEVYYGTMPVSKTNPIYFWPDSFFDVFLDASGPIHPMEPIHIPPEGFLIAREQIAFTNNAGEPEPEYRWVWEIHEAHPPKPPAEHLKWSQPPLEMDPCMPQPTYCGWNEASWTNDPCGQYIFHAAADDFRCIGSMPVTSIHWWGSFINWTAPTLPPQTPSVWNVKFFANVPAGVLPYSHPGEVVWEVNIPNNRVQTEWNGYDYHPQYGTESCFQHYIDLTPEEYFHQDDYNDPNNIYWLGITAVYPQGMEVLNPWGWKTRPAHWMDDAVHYERFPGPSGPIWEYWPLEDPITLESVDLAFELDTDPNYIKWEQPYTGIRDWPHYDDELSMAEDYGTSLNIMSQAADDWKCEKRTPVTSIVWWGSYLGYNYQPCIITTTLPPVKPDYFMINIWTDVPATSGPDPNHSHPGTVLWGYKAYDYDEVMVGYDKQPEYQTGPPREAVFRYSVRLPEDKWFKQRKVNQIYWISIMAVYQNNYPNYQWGWTNHKHFFNDDAVKGHWEYRPEQVWVWEEIYDQTGASADLSFMLFTDPSKCVSCADYNWSGTVEFKDYAVFALDWMWSGLPGGYNNGDLNCNGDVNYEDLKIFRDQWLQSCP